MIQIETQLATLKERASLEGSIVISEEGNLNLHSYVLSDDSKVIVEYRYEKERTALESAFFSHNGEVLNLNERDLIDLGIFEDDHEEDESIPLMD